MVGDDKYMDVGVFVDFVYFLNEFVEYGIGYGVFFFCLVDGECGDVVFYGIKDKV